MLAKHRLISCSEAMAELRDDAGKCPFGKWDIEKNQWKLQRMFTQLEADSFKDPTKGEIYVMLYEIFYGNKEVVTKLGTVVEVDLELNEKVIIIREMLKIGGHYAPEKSEGELTGKLIVEFGKGNLHPLVPDTKNRMKAYDN